MPADPEPGIAAVGRLLLEQHLDNFAETTALAGLAASVGPGVTQPDASRFAVELRDAWRQIVSGEHAVALAFQWQEAVERVLGPAERRQFILAFVASAVDEHGDAALDAISAAVTGLEP